MLQVGRHQIVLARELAVEGDLGDMGLANDPVNASGADPLPIEKRMRSVQDALTHAHRGQVGVFALQSNQQMYHGPHSRQIRLQRLAFNDVDRSVYMMDIP